ncbi:hypothetical protein NL455_30060, partial [Klebsiella pneumoniae]|nr:hypothetical protein [Klebsiella pneumoniae]
FPTMSAVCAFCFGALSGGVAGVLSLLLQAALHGAAELPWVTAAAQTAAVLALACACRVARGAQDSYGPQGPHGRQE